MFAGKSMIATVVLLQLLAALVVEPAAALPPRVFGELFEPPEPEDHRYNVKFYGAVGDGVHNDTDAFLRTIHAASRAVNYSSVVVPEGRFLVWPMLLEECVNTWIEVEGAIVAPQEPSDWPQNEYYIHFVSPNNCSLVGRGPAAEIEGNGMAWWAREGGTDSPALIQFSGEFDGYPEPCIANISLFNAASAHVKISSTRMYSGPQLFGVKIRATDRGESSGILALNASLFMENMDIDVGGVNVLMRTGYGDMNRGFMRIDHSTLKRGAGVVVEMTDGIMGNISLYNLNFIGTSYGVQALGARDGNGQLLGLFCDNLNMIDVGIPIRVSNDYCPRDNHGCTRPAKGVTITMINFDVVSATQSGGSAGDMQCIAAKPCSISMYNIDVRPNSPGVANAFHCSNAVGYTDGTVSPASCLKKQGSSPLDQWL